MADGDYPAIRGEARNRLGRGLAVLWIGLTVFAAAAARGQDIERDPINYSAAKPRNAVSRLQERLATGKAKLEVKEYIYQRLWEILNGRATEKDDPQIATADREAILEILRETKPGLPDSWK